MADYHISVRNYHWSHQNTVVQSPVLNLISPVPSLIVRPLEGIDRDEPRIINNVVDLRDDIHDDAYQDEAHGVFISTDSQGIDPFPVWVPVNYHKCEENEVHVVNLKTFEATNIPIAHICWVPGLEAPDGNLYTIIGAPREMLRAMQVIVLVQKIGCPKDVKLTFLEPSVLAGYKEIGDVRKKKLFEIQLIALRTESGPPSEITLGAYRLYSSPYRHDRDRHSLDQILVGDFEIPRPPRFDYGSHDSFDSSSDDDSLYDAPICVSLVESPNRPYSCDCRYADLHPTSYNPRPNHRHGTDDECDLGSTHVKHCIFADAAPDKCVIPGSGEPHRHCIDPFQAMETELQTIAGTSCFVEGETLLEQAENELDNPDPIDLEPVFVDSPSIESLPEPDSDLESFHSSDMGSLRLSDSSLTSQSLEGQVWNPRFYLDVRASPGPQDLQF
ncbi:hypothetical protein F4677DRAFT_301719 [Hypoxylon crocopeplum]|nr:hypothetical protein F4677DRAFT_301719 [Hypoxylon crocopeplum]